MLNTLGGITNVNGEGTKVVIINTYTTNGYLTHYINEYYYSDFNVENEKIYIYNSFCKFEYKITNNVIKVTNPPKIKVINDEFDADTLEEFDVSNDRIPIDISGNIQYIIRNIEDNFKYTIHVNNIWTQEKQYHGIQNIMNTKVTIIEDNINPQLQCQYFHILKEYMIELEVNQFINNLDNYYVDSIHTNEDGNMFVVIKKKNNEYRMYIYDYIIIEKQYKCTDILHIKQDFKYFDIDTNNVIYIVYYTDTSINIDIYVKTIRYELWYKQIINNVTTNFNFTLNNLNEIVIQYENNVNGLGSGTFDYIAFNYSNGNLTDISLNYISNKIPTDISYNLIVYDFSTYVFKSESGKNVIVYYKNTEILFSAIDGMVINDCKLINKTNKYILLFYETKVEYFEISESRETKTINIQKTKTIDLLGNLFFNTINNLYSIKKNSDNFLLEISDIFDEKVKKIKLQFFISMKKEIINPLGSKLIYCDSNDRINVLYLPNNNNTFDLNYDGVYDLHDRHIIANHIIGKANVKTENILRNDIIDVNLRGKVDIRDIIYNL